MPFGSTCPERRCLPRAGRRSAVLLALLAACVGGTQAASQAPTTFRSGTELVVMQVSVVDGRGHFVPGLERDDFSVFEEGAPQTVALFGSAEATPPIATDRRPFPDPSRERGS